MKITKNVQGKIVELKLVKIRDYSSYALYQVYRIISNKEIPIYRECYTELDIKEIMSKGNRIGEEIFI